MSMYSKLFDIVNMHLPSIGCYDNDTHLYLALSPTVEGEDEIALNDIHDCINNLKNWMIESLLMLNNGKADFLLKGPRQQLKKGNVGNTPCITKAELKLNLGSWFDCLDMSDILVN